MKNIFTLTDVLDLFVGPEYADMAEAVSYTSSPLCDGYIVKRVDLGNPDGTFNSRAVAEALEFKNSVLEHALNYEVKDLDNTHYFSCTHIFTFIGGKFFLKLRLEK